jgi:hypothetical protein
LYAEPTGEGEIDAEDPEDDYYSTAFTLAEDYDKFELCLFSSTDLLDSQAGRSFVKNKLPLEDISEISSYNLHCWNKI